MKAYIPFLILSCMTLGIVKAEVVTLKNGETLEGKLVSKSKEEVILETFDGKVTIKTSDIQSHQTTKSLYEKYQDKTANLDEKDADAQYAVALWSAEQKLWAIANRHVQKALTINPDHSKAKDLKKKIAILPMTLNVGVKQNLPEDHVRKMVDPVNKASKRIAEITGGVMYIETVIFTIGSAKGDLVYDETYTKSPNGWTNIPVNKEYWRPTLILHEFGHCKLGLLDEVGKTKETSCSECIMAWRRDVGYCSKVNHVKGLGNSPGCQEILSEKYPELKIGFARPAQEVKEILRGIPETQVVIKHAR